MGKYLLKDTPSGVKTLLYNNDREIRLHSAHDPIKEAKRSVDSFHPGRANIIIVCGIALGYHILLLKEKYPSCTIIALEYDIEVVKIASKTNEETLKDVAIIHGTNDLSGIFEDIDISAIKGAATYYHRPSYMLFKGFYNDILIQIKEYLASKVSDLLTRFEFEEKWFENIFKNVHNVFKSAQVKNLFGKFRGYPGIIVSAGPSLRNNVKWLARLRDRALIVSVDTALKVLEKHDVKPHMVMTLDSQKYSIKHFLGLTDNTPALLADVVSYPRVIDTYKGHRILSTTSKFYTDMKGNFKRETTPVWDWAEQFTGEIGDIQSGGSVATSIFDLLLNLGCSQIILVGQDLAYTGREIHCTGTYHNDEWLPKTSRFQTLETINQAVVRKRKIKYIESYNGREKILSDFVFDLYRSWFGDSSNRVNIPVINATEGGARIDNTSQATLEELEKTLKTQKVKPQAILDEFINTENKMDHQPLYNEISRVIESLNELNAIVKKEQDHSATQDAAILTAMDRLNVAKIITPFLRKTTVYLTRNPDLAPERASEIFITEIANASNKLLKSLDLSKKNLQKIR